MVSKVELPLGRQIHPLFYIDRLKWYIHLDGFIWEVEPPPPILVKDLLEYEIEGLIHHRGHGAHQ